MIPMDYGRPMRPFFIEIQNFWAFQINWADKFLGIWDIFSQTISEKKLSLYINIPNIFLGFEPQRIRDLAFVCP